MYTKFVYVYIKNKKSRKKLKNKKTDRKIQTKKTGHASPQGGPPPPLSLRARYVTRHAGDGVRSSAFFRYCLKSSKKLNTPAL